jgi:hypothetical protein
MVKSFLLMTSSGIIHVFWDGSTKTITLDAWAMKQSLFDTILKFKNLPFLVIPHFNL